MLCTIIDLLCVRIAVVKVDFAQLVEPVATRTLWDVQPRFGVVPVLLVAFNDPMLSDIKGFAEFRPEAYVADLVEWNSLEPVEWGQLPELPEEALPF